ncbi:hypothetical protein AURDEDRAFT_188262 [Auricularia subglabra TFB-10046 SS5]|nr:hypothetical protein AURDEDRAFT_188262 [Auricularia subglabra TFB-10046 SS5]
MASMDEARINELDAQMRRMTDSIAADMRQLGVGGVEPQYIKMDSYRPEEYPAAIVSGWALPTDVFGPEHAEDDWQELWEFISTQIPQARIKLVAVDDEPDYFYIALAVQPISSSSTAVPPLDMRDPATSERINLCTQLISRYRAAPPGPPQVYHVVEPSIYPGTLIEVPLWGPSHAMPTVQPLPLGQSGQPPPIPNFGQQSDNLPSPAGPLI